MGVELVKGAPGPSDVPGVIPPGSQELTWQAVTPAANTAATITIAAVAGKRHHLLFFGWSYSAAPTGGEISVSDGATVMFDLLVPNEWVEHSHIPDAGIVGTVNTAMTVSLTAGGAAVSGSVTIGYFTV